MSKEAALRAMREANFAQRAAGPAAAPKKAKPAVRPASTEPTPPVATAAPDDTLCGHRSMNGRACTREQGHAAKSHRYS